MTQDLALARLAVACVVLGLALLVWAVAAFVWPWLRLSGAAGELWLALCLLAARFGTDVSCERLGVGPPVRWVHGMDTDR